MKMLVLLATLSVTAFLAGCAMDQHAAADGAQHAECSVCKMNVDLACLDVKVTEKTPTYMYNDQTYYFCSDECHDKFAKDPAKYAKK